MCPRISVPISSSSSFSSSFSSSSSSSSSCLPSLQVHVRVRMHVRIVYMYVYIYIKKSHLRRTCERWWTTLLHRHPPSHSPFPSLLSLLFYVSHAGYILPIPFSTYNLHASIVQTDDENYLRFSANAINQKRRSASPPGPLDRQGYPPPPRRSVSLAPPLAFDSTRLRRLIIHD